MLKKIMATGLILLSSCLLSACLHLGNLSYKQTRMLKQEGFALTEEGWSLALPERLLFAFNDFTIQDQQAQELIRLSQHLHQYHLDKIKIIGHTDNIGEQNYNQQLSLKRANSVSEIFLANGFNPQNVQTIGKGSSQPIANNDSDENRAKNRRVTIVIIP
ncbi:OmpA family protein [Acinetobacter sp. MD2(2019)]|uniref:OmpA family protein n=1 Tax=Acinetobacter sp. MD2(2019) TaxID=2605273 RepID=UPI002D1E7295|nr:OmpA family protein [Acinetobacter sp. MD2(2019)]MEB3755092.1 OmpA family protein [Acinetobacter sp. MD2(2019)]